MLELICAPILLGAGLSMAPPTPPPSELHIAAPGSRSEKVALAVTPQTADVATGSESQDSGERKPQVIEVVGCLTSRPNDSWGLTTATQPRTVETSSSERAELGSLGPYPSLDRPGIFNPSIHANHKVRVQGLPVKDGINVTSLTMLSEQCAK